MLLSKAKAILRQMFIRAGWDVTSNIKYDRLTLYLLRQELREDANCIDIGAHKGEIVDSFLEYSPKGKHYAFEPIPDLCNALRSKYDNRVSVLAYAIGDQARTDFFYVPQKYSAYSGLQQREYPTGVKQVNEVTVSIELLDNVLPSSYRPDFIKLDIEGGEYHALLGAKKTIKKYHPLLLFEYGKGAAEYYDVSPEMMYELLVSNYGYDLHALPSFIKRNDPLSLPDFRNHYTRNSEYYFVAKYCHK